jgi:hypothetical protein
MAANTFQKIAILNITAQLENDLKNYLTLGYVIQSWLIYQDKLIVLYATPKLPEPE